VVGRCGGALEAGGGQSEIAHLDGGSFIRVNDLMTLANKGLSEAQLPWRCLETTNPVDSAIRVGRVFGLSKAQRKHRDPASLSSLRFAADRTRKREFFRRWRVTARGRSVTIAIKRPTAPVEKPLRPSELHENAAMTDDNAFADLMARVRRGDSADARRVQFQRAAGRVSRELGLEDDDE
jgi:hypothetical protein